MRCESLLLLAAWLAISSADSEDGPFDFLFSRCEGQQGVVGVSGCVRDLFTRALDQARPKFFTGFEVGDKTVVLEPLKMPKPEGGGGRSSKLQVSTAQLLGLSGLQVDSVMLTDSVAAAKVEFDELAGEVSGKIYYGFLPIRATVTVKLLSPKVMVAAKWDEEDGALQLKEPRTELWIDGYNITIKGMGSMGKTLATKLNENHKEIFEFLKPSLEAAVARRIDKMDQKDRNAALSWLEDVISNIDEVA